MKNLSNNQLYELCIEYGKRALRARRKFTGLLPEVLKRRLYEKKGYSSIYEFAAKLAGISKEQVNRVICLERRLDDLPLLKTALIEGKISSHKLERVATIATSENQNEILTKAIAMPIRVLETYIKDIKREDTEEENIFNTEDLFTGNPEMFSINSTGNNEDGSQNSLIKADNKDGLYMARTKGEYVGANVLAGEKPHLEANLEFGKKPQERADSRAGEHSQEGATSEAETFWDGKPSPKELLENLQTLNLSRSTIQRLKELKSKGFDLDELINELLDKRESEIAEDLAEYVEMPDSTSNVYGTPINPSRHIPQKIRQILKRQYGTKCAIPGCRKDSQHIHHTNRFAISHVHNPYYMAPLCAEHHKLAHLLDHRYKEKINAP